MSKLGSGRVFLSSLFLAVPLFGAPCTLGTLDDYIGLGSGGCSIGSYTLADFTAIPPLLVGSTEIDPTAVSITPIPLSAPFIGLQVDTDVSADVGDFFATFFRFRIDGTLFGADLSLTPGRVAGDGLILGIVDLCADGTFDPTGPTGCTGTPESLIVGEIPDFLFSPDFDNIPASFFDVFVELSVDGGVSGSAASGSLSLRFDTGIPEPSSLLLMAAGLMSIAFFRRR